MALGFLVPARSLLFCWTVTNQTQNFIAGLIFLWDRNWVIRIIQSSIPHSREIFYMGQSDSWAINMAWLINQIFLRATHGQLLLATREGSGAIQARGWIWFSSSKRIMVIWAEIRGLLRLLWNLKWVV